MNTFNGVELRMRKIDSDPETFVINEYTFNSCKNLIYDCVSAMITPEDNTPDTVIVVGLACTSMSFIIGSDSVDDILKRACPSARTTNMCRTQLNAIKELNLSTVSLLTPYIDSIATSNAKILSTVTQVVKHRTLNLYHDNMTSSIDPNKIIDYVLRIDSPEAQGIVIGCSAFRVCAPNFIDHLESICGKPVITSTQAFIWGMLRLGGVFDNINGYGCLLRNS